MGAEEGQKAKRILRFKPVIPNYKDNYHENLVLILSILGLLTELEFNVLTKLIMVFQIDNESQILKRTFKRSKTFSQVYFC